MPRRNRPKHRKRRNDDEPDVPTIPAPQHGDVQGGSDGAGNQLFLAIYWTPNYYVFWTRGSGYLDPPVRWNSGVDAWFQWCEWR